MSTAGKVLTILVLLVMIAWIVLLSAVTQLNVNWEQKIAQQQKDLDKATADSAKAVKDTIRLIEDARSEQDTADRDLRASLGRIAAAERALSAKTESLTRLKFQVAGVQADAQKAEVNLANRKAEKVKTEEDLAKKRDEITKAQAENADLRDQLVKLQTDFKRLLAENAAKVQKAKEAPASKPVSGRRESPSS